MEDLASLPAFMFIEEQVVAGHISAVMGDGLKTKFAELYRASNAAIEREKDLVAKARDLRTSVRDEQIALEKARIRKEQLEAMHLEAELSRKKLASTLESIEVKQREHQQDLHELRMREHTLADDVAALRKENEAIVAPQLDALIEDIAEGKGDLQRAQSQMDGLMQQKASLQRQLEELDGDLLASNTTCNAMKMELMRVKGEPQRAEKVLDTVSRALSDLNAEIKQLQAQIAARDATMAEQKAALDSLDGVAKEVNTKLGQYMRDISQREREIAAVDHSRTSERMQYKELLERRIDVQSEETAALAAARGLESDRDALTAAYERAKRELKRKTDQVNEAQAMVPVLEAQLTERNLELQRLQAEGADCEAQLASLKREIDVLLAQFMKTEGIEKKHKEAASELAELCSQLEVEKSQWHREEMLCHKQIVALKAQRDIKSRDLAKMVASRKTVIEQSKIKELQLLDLTKQLADINAKLRQFAAVYEVVKSERNTFANNIQSASQSIAEMRERIKILHNEVDILQNESNAKDKALTKEKQAHAVAAVQRDALRAETNKASLSYREKQASVEGQITVIDKLNAIINRLEGEMLTLKKDYEHAVETRNYTGIHLIDRNDELCILYEKSNIHEQTLGTGERELRVITDEVRSLKLSIADLERRLQLAKSKFPETPLWAEKILELQKQLVVARQTTEQLCANLESPACSDRWMELRGEDPDVEQLKLRASRLEATLNAARGEYLEKELVLEEISTLAERLTAAASAVDAGGSAAETPAALARQANELQSKIKDVNKKLMAVVSELSMYQATTIKLSSECATAQEALDRAKEAAARGLPPTLAAEQRWLSMERAKSLPPGAAAQKLDASVVDGPKTTADPRPNAYIPADIGLPKPYGEFAPFKPSQPGAIMRFFRNPEVPELEM